MNDFCEMIKTVTAEQLKECAIKHLDIDLYLKLWLEIEATNRIYLRFSLKHFSKYQSNILRVKISVCFITGISAICFFSNANHIVEGILLVCLGTGEYIFQVD